MVYTLGGAGKRASVVVSEIAGLRNGRRTVGSIVDGVKTQYRSMAGYRLLGNERVVVSGHPAQRLDVELTHRDARWRRRHLVVRVGARFLAVSCAAPRARFTSVGCLRLLASLELPHE